MASFEFCSQLAEFFGQFPISINGRVIQIGWLALERHQVMPRIKDLFSLSIVTIMPRDHLTLMDDFEVVHVGFHHHGLEGVTPGNAVAVLFKRHRLVLVRLADGRHCRIKVPLG